MANNEQAYQGILDQYGSVDNYYASSQFTDLNKLQQQQIKNILKGFTQPAQPAQPAQQAQQVQQVQQTTQQAQQAQPVQQTTQWDYKDDSGARQQQILSNLASEVANSPQLFRDYNTFASTHAYDQRTEQQRKLLDDWYFGYDEGRTLSTQTARSLADQYSAGTITQAQLQNIKTYDPTKYASTMDFINKGAILSSYNSQLNPKQSENPFQGIINNITQGLQQTQQAPQLYNEYKELINSDELKQATNMINDYTKQIETIDEQLNNIKKDVEKRYVGTGATSTKINAIIADESYELTRQKNNLAIQMNSEVSKYNTRMQTIQQDIQLKLQDYNLSQQALQTQMQQVGMLQNLMSFETPEQQDERAWNNFIRQQEYQDGNIYSNDPATRRKAISNAVDNVLNEFAGIPMKRSREQMIQDIQNMVDNGTDLGTAITQNIRDPIMKKPEYISYIQQKFPQQTVTIGGIPYTKDSNGNLVAPNIITPENLQGGELMRVLASGKYNGQKFFGVYATGDADGTNREKLYYTAQNVGLEAFINRYKGTSITAEMVNNTAQKYNVDPLMVATIMAADSSMGTKGIGARNFNPGNVGQFDSLGTTPTAGYGSWQEGVDAVGKNLASRMQALAKMTGTTGTAGTIGTGTAGTGAYNDVALSMFNAYMTDKNALGKTQGEMKDNLAAMGFASSAEFKAAAENRAKQQVVETPQPVKDATKYILENPLFDTVVNGVNVKGILGKGGKLDIAMVNKIEGNIAAGRGALEGVSLIYQMATDTARLTKFVNSLQTLRGSGVVDIVKGGQIKLYPMSDADIALLASTAGLTLGQFAQGQNTMNALSNMYKAMTTQQSTSQSQQPTGMTNIDKLKINSGSMTSNPYANSGFINQFIY